MIGEPARTINAVFPHKVCINLDRRADRWEQMQAKFRQHGILSVRRFAAADGQDLVVPRRWSSTVGAYGCLLSHVEVVREAHELGLPSVLIFEDDVLFAEALQENFAAGVRQLPDDWDMLYFGALHMDDLIETSPNIKQIRRAYSTYAYALNHTIFEAFIALNSNADAPVDINNLRLQSEHRCYCFLPHLAWVENDYSDAQEVFKNHWYLKESLVIHGQSMDQLLQTTSLIMAHHNPYRKESMTRNLLFLARFYQERLPGISVVIVEQDLAPSLDPSCLPEGCRYFLLREEGALNRGLCFDTGLRISNPRNSLIIFSDSDIFVEEWDICGNLRMCQRYDCATGFSSIVALSSADTLQLQADRTMLMRWFRATAYPLHKKSDAYSSFCIFNRESFQNAGGWNEQRPTEQVECHLALHSNKQLKVFDAPNYALRLHH